MRKMTEPRRDLLADIVKRPQHCHLDYPPARWLVSQGFVTAKEGRMGSAPVLTATEAGRLALAEQEKGR